MDIAKPLLDRLTPEQRAFVAQFLRYALTGGFVTFIGAGAYWIWATPFHYHPLVATVIAYVVSMALGYVLHSRYSFRGHGEGGRHAARTVKFVAVSLVSLALNSTWVWLLTGWLRGPTWWPIPAMVFVTPVIVFALNRKWVFA